MTITVWIAFVFTASFILFIPGPTIIFVVSQSLFHGKKAAIPLTLGVVLGDAICMTFSILGLGAVLAISSMMFTIIKMLGAAYLIYLGINMLFSSNVNYNISRSNGSFNSKSLTQSSFLVTALNPKGIIFYSAFMPQFFDPSSNLIAQFAILSSTFLFLALVNTLCYSLLAVRVSQLWRSNSNTHWFNYTGGIAMIGAGVATATLDRK